jgi:hypothetical protein
MKATLAVLFTANGTAGMISLLEQQQGGVFLPSELFRPGKQNAVPGDHKTASLDKCA